jgi:two-component system CheB/CheR fusion protein
MTKKKNIRQSKKAPPAMPPPAPPAAEAASALCPVAGIGASAGGMEAFTELLQHLPHDTGMSFVLVQHLDPKHTSLLTELLGKSTLYRLSAPQSG